MEETSEVPAIPPQDVSQQYHYQPVMDPHSEFGWHHPNAQIREEAQENKFDMTEFHNPWDLYRGHIASNTIETESNPSTELVRLENQDEIRKYVWEHGAQENSHRDNQPHRIDHHWQNNSQEQNLHRESNPQQNDHFWQHTSQQHEHYWQAAPQQQESHWHSDPIDVQYFEHHSQQHESHSQPNPQQHEYYREPNPHQHEHQCQPDPQHLEAHWQPHTYQHEDHSQSYPQQHVQHSHKDNTHTTNHIHDEHSHQYNLHTQLEHNHNHDNSSPAYHHEHQKQNITVEKIEVHSNYVQNIINKDIYKSEGMNGDISESESEYHEEIPPRHPYDGFYLRHRITIDARGRKICSHEIPPSPPPDLKTINISSFAEDEQISTCNDEEQVSYIQCSRNAKTAGILF